MPEVAASQAGWATVAFGDVIRQVKDKVDPEESGLERYIAGEHMHTDDLRIRSWGEIGDDYLGPAFHMRFQPGHVLYGSRRTYLRKVALAEFEGITANTTYVLESKDPSVLLPELVPFIMQAESFHAHSKRESKGSVNPYVNFSDLAWYEFALPPLEEQRRIAEVLYAAESHVNHLRSLTLSAEVLFQSAVDRWFPAKGKIDSGYVPLAEICSKISDGVHKKPDYVESGVPFLTVENLTKGPGIDFAETRFVSQEDHAEFCKRTKPECGDVLLTKDGTLGVARVIETDAELSIFVSLALVKPRKELLDSWYLRYYFDSSLFKRHIASRVAGSALKHIHLVDLRASPIPVKDIEQQREIAGSISTVYRAYRASLERFDSSRNILRGILAAALEVRA